MRRLRDYSGQVAQRGVEINVLPMIDCMMFLLIFFVSTTVFVQESGVEVQKPKASSASTQALESMLIALTADGQIVYGGKVVELNAVRGLVALQMHAKTVPVVILADAGARTGKLVDLIDECKLAGAEQVSLAATPEPL